MELTIIEELKQTSYMQLIMNSDIPEKEFELIFLEFTQKIYDFCTKENNKKIVYFTLHYFRSLLVNLAGKGQGEDCLVIHSGIHFLDAALEWGDKNEYQSLPVTSEKKLVTKVIWTGKIVHFVEWVYGPHALKHFNDGNITAKDLVEHLSNALNIEVKDAPGCYCDMRKRVREDRTSYLDSVRDALLKRMEQDDEKYRKRL